MKKSTAAAIGIAALAVGLLTACTGTQVEPPKSVPVASVQPSTPEDEETEWAEVEEPLTLEDTLTGRANFKMLRPGPDPYQDQLYYRYSGQGVTDGVEHLVLGEDGVVDLLFEFSGPLTGEQVLRYIADAYITDSAKSKSRKAGLSCKQDPDSQRQVFICQGRFSVPGNPGGTYYGVIETKPSNLEQEAYGPKRTVASITVEPFGSRGPICKELSDFGDELMCNSLPKEEG